MSDIKKTLISGVAYTAIAKYSGIIISLIVTAVLARLIVPEEFGIVAIATVIITFFAIFSDLGIAPAIVQNKELNEKDLSNIFSFTLFMGLILAVLFFFSSLLIADYYDKKILIPICRILSINLLFSSLNIVPNALLFKNKQFKFIAYRTLTVQLLAGVLAVAAALFGLGIYSLLINPVISSVAMFIMSYIKYPQSLSIRFSLSSMKKIFSFSFYQFMFNLINYFSRNLDKLMIGKYLGMSPLGYYEKSYRLMMLPLQNITNVITPVMHPVFADFQNDLKLLSSSYLKVIKLLSFVGFPLSVILFFTSEELVLIIFGNQWKASVMAFQILSASVGFQIILSTSGSIFQASNNTKVMFISGVLSTILTIVGICTGIFVFKTIEWVAICILISFVINFIQCFILLYKVSLRLSILPFFKQLISPIILSAIIFIPLFAMEKYMPEINIILSLCIKCALSAIIGISYIQITKEYDIISKTKSIFKKKRI